VVGAIDLREGGWGIWGVVRSNLRDECIHEALCFGVCKVGRRGWNLRCGGDGARVLPG